MKRQFNFDEDGPSDKEKAEKALIAKKEKMAKELQRLLSAEKRWMSKLKRATTAVNKTRVAVRRLNKRRDALD